MDSDLREDVIELLSQCSEFLDNYADAEGNSAADWKPNKAMRLMTDVDAMLDKLERK